MFSGTEKYVRELEHACVVKYNYHAETDRESWNPAISVFFVLHGSHGIQLSRELGPVMPHDVFALHSQAAFNLSSTFVLLAPWTV